LAGALAGQLRYQRLYVKMVSRISYCPAGWSRAIFTYLFKIKLSQNFPDVVFGRG